MMRGILSLLDNFWLFTAAADLLLVTAANLWPEVEAKQENKLRKTKR